MCRSDVRSPVSFSLVAPFLQENDGGSPVSESFW